MPEAIVLDPVAMAPDRTELRLTSIGIDVAEQGPDWGESQVEVQTARQTIGEMVTDRHASSVEMTIPLIVRPENGVSLADAAHRLQQKVATFQREGGWIRRDFDAGGKFAGSVAYRITNAALSGLQGWLMANRQTAKDVTLRLTRDPRCFSTAEVESAIFEEVSNRHLIWEINEMLGSTDGLMRLRVTNKNSSGDWRGLISAIECRDHPQDATKDTTAKLAYLAEDLSPKGGATVTGGVVEHTSLTAGWLSILNSQITPTIRAVGAVASGTGAISPGLPAGTEAGDLLIMPAESGGATEATEANAELTASGWTKLETQKKGNTRLTILYQVAATASPATTTNDTGDHQLARIIGIKKGTFDPSSPFNITAAGTQASTKSVSIPGATTTRDKCLVIACASGHLPDATTTAEFGAATNASLSELTERIDNTVTAGDGGAIYAVSGYKLTAGAYSATTCTAVTEAERGVISFAINPLNSNYPTHKGVRRLWVRAEDTGVNPGDVELRIRWRTLGSLAWSEENAIVPSPVVDAYQLYDLGECRPQPALLGSDRWEFDIQARAPGGSGAVRIKDVYPLPVGEQDAVLRAPDATHGADTQSTKPPGTVVDDAGTGSIAWTNPGNVKVSDNTYATASLSTGQRTHYLKATNFGFALAEGSTIAGIIATVERKASTIQVHDASVRIVKAGTIQSAVDKGGGSLWPLTDGLQVFGSAEDLWGQTWTAAEINNSGFGVAIAAEVFLVESAVTLSADLITLGVYYTEASDENRICFATRSVELRSDGVVRQHPKDDVWGPVIPEGSLPYAPPSALEGRKIRGILIPTQGDLGELADSGTNKLNAQVIYQPAHLFAREAG